MILATPAVFQLIASLINIGILEAEYHGDFFLAASCREPDQGGRWSVPVKESQERSLVLNNFVRSQPSFQAFGASHSLDCMVAQLAANRSSGLGLLRSVIWPYLAGHGHIAYRSKQLL